MCVILFGKVFHNLGAVNKKQVSQDFFNLVIWNLKLSEKQVVIGFHQETTI